MEALAMAVRAGTMGGWAPTRDTLLVLRASKDSTMRAYSWRESTASAGGSGPADASTALGRRVVLV